MNDLDGDELAARVLDKAKRGGLKIAAAESLTGGLLADAFVRIPGASQVFLGSAVTYDIAAKASVLGVDASLLREQGAVNPQVACQMAQGAAKLYNQPQYDEKIIGLSTTGVAGPGSDGGKPAGLVYVGISMPGKSRDCERSTTAFKLELPGDREQVRRGAVIALLAKVNQIT